MADVSTLRLLLWQAGAVRCGAPIERLARVLPVQPVTPIPGAPRGVRGLVNVRGELVTVVDCRTLLGEPDVDAAADLVLVRSGARMIGLEVDEVHDIVTVPDSALRPGPSGAEWQVNLGDGSVARLLDLDALLSPLFPD
jgi:purine-binding chemotaxis protein CheW